MKLSATLLTAAALAMAGASATRAQTEPAADAAPKKFVEAAGPVGVGAPASTKSKIICRRDVEIGSLVKGVRRCGTADEWRRSSEAARKTTADIQDQKGAFIAR
jgi:hypothetical protein